MNLNFEEMDIEKVLLEKVISQTKKGTVIKWKKIATKNEEAFADSKKKLMDQRKTFKIVDNQQNTVYNFNGNNYIVTSKTAS